MDWAHPGDNSNDNAVLTPSGKLENISMLQHDDCRSPITTKASKVWGVSFASSSSEEMLLSPIEGKISVRVDAGRGVLMYDCCEHTPKLRADLTTGDVHSPGEMDLLPPTNR